MEKNLVIGIASAVLWAGVASCGSGIHSDVRPLPPPKDGSAPAKDAAGAPDTGDAAGQNDDTGASGGGGGTRDGAADASGGRDGATVADGIAGSGGRDGGTGPDLPPGALCVSSVSAGYVHTCAQRGDGTAWCWGNNGSGQLGDGTNNATSIPAQVSGLGSNVVDVVAGPFRTCARKADGTLWCWGGGSSLPPPAHVSALGANVVQVAVGVDHRCARKADGTLWCWGGNSKGQLGDGTTTDRPSSPIQVGALGASVADVAALFLATCARKTDGTLWCWGDNRSGQLGDGTTTDRSSPVQVKALGANVTHVMLGFTHGCARKEDGTLWCWGSNTYGTLGDGTTTQRLSPVEVSGLGTTVTAADAGFHHTCARTEDGKLWCWGDNSNGALGTGNFAGSSSPVHVKSLGNRVVDVSAGNHVTCARTGDGILWCWGANDCGQLGNGIPDPKPYDACRPAVGAAVGSQKTSPNPAMVMKLCN